MKENLLRLKTDFLLCLLVGLLRRSGGRDVSESAAAVGREWTTHASASEETI